MCRASQRLYFVGIGPRCGLAQLECIYRVRAGATIDQTAVISVVMIASIFSMLVRELAAK